jgi:hypothetical protein
MKKSYPAVAVCCIAGMMAGYTVRHLTTGHADGQAGSAEQTEQGTSAGTQPGDGATSTKGKKPAFLLKGPHSTDTLETVLGLGFEKGDYARLSAWMLDASEQDITAYWQNYRQKNGEDNDIYDLIFINWTRLNPQSAVAATKGTPNEKHAWWAWACHDPKNALATAKATNPDFVQHVGWGIGEFHPDWLMKNFDQIPESARQFSVMGLCKWDDYPDPLKIMNFLKENNQGFISGIFKTLIRKDPLVALDWIQQNGEPGRQRFYSLEDMDPTAVYMTTLSETHPDLLEKIADELPSGAVKWKMQAAQFDHLLKTDPDAAIEMATSTKAPKIAVDRLSAAGLSLIESDTSKAFELAKKMIELSPNPFSEAGMSAVYPGGMLVFGGNNQDAKKFESALIAKDPVQAMALALPTGSSPNTEVFSSLASEWADSDVSAYSSWVDQQTDPVVRDPATQVICNKLASEQNYSIAMEWVMSQSESARPQNLRNLLQRWKNDDPDAAKAWFANANLQGSEKENLSVIFGKQ